MRKWMIGGSVLGLLVLLGLGLAGNYFYDIAVVRGPKSYIQHAGQLKRSDPNYQAKLWYQKVPKRIWRQTATDGQTKLVGWYIPAEKSQRTVLLVHGFNGDKSQMGAWAGMYHQLGYNVLAVDQRAAGQSGGQAVGYGWLDHRDYLKWAKLIVQKTKAQSIVMSGISMGAAGLLMTSGEHQIPQIKAYVVDSAFTSASAIISYQAHQMYHLPAWPLVPITSGITRLRAGYFFGTANAVKQVRHSTRPILFLAGGADRFVPVKMSHELYTATASPKQMVIFKGAGHTTAIARQPHRYQNVVQRFLKQYGGD